MRYRMSEGMANIGEVLKEAMERTPRPKEPEQEPVAWMNKDGWIGLYKQGDANIPLYTTPPQRTWVGLTDEEMYRYCPNWLSQADFQALMLHIEAKLKEKNHVTSN